MQGKRQCVYLDKTTEAACYVLTAYRMDVHRFFLKILPRMGRKLLKL